MLRKQSVSSDRKYCPQHLRYCDKWIVTWIKCKYRRSVLKSKYSEKDFSEPPTGVEYDLAHHESPIAQWLERPTGTFWKVMGSTPVGGSEKSSSEYFDLRTLLRYLSSILTTLFKEVQILFR